MTVSIGNGGDFGYYERGADDEHEIDRAERQAQDISALAEMLHDNGPRATDYAEYLLGQRELNGVWKGAGAAKLGLTGKVKSWQGHRLYGKHEDPNTGQKLGKPQKQYKSYEERLAIALAKEPFATEDRKREIELSVDPVTKQNRMFYDVTFSLPKEYSLLHAALLAAGRNDEAQIIIDAQHEAIDECMRLMQDEHGYSRRGHMGRKVAGNNTVEYVRAQEFVYSEFDHRTSRCGDMNLHTHVLVNSTVECEDDGEWRAIFMQPIYKTKRQMGALHERLVAERVSHRLGVRLIPRANGFGWTIDGITQEDIDLNSSRRRAIEPEIAARVASFVERYGRQPTKREMHDLSQAATLKTRPSKPHERSYDEYIAEWDARYVESTGKHLVELLDRVPMGPPHEPVPHGVVDRDRIIQMAIARCDSRSATWGRHDLRRELSDLLPPNLGRTDIDDVRAYLDSLVDEAIRGDMVDSLHQAPAVVPPASLEREPGVSVYEPPHRERFAKAQRLPRESRMAHRTQEFDGPRLTERDAHLLLDQTTLYPEQREVVFEILTRGQRLIFVEGVAGCIAGETELWDPVAMRGRRVDELEATKTRPWVQTLSGPVLAEVPYVKGTADLYRVTLANGRSCIATDDHLFLERGGWTFVSELRGGLAEGKELLSGSPVGAQRCSGTGGGSPAGCHQSHGYGDPLLPPDLVAARSFAPSQVDALGRSQPSSQKDGAVRKSARSHPCLRCAHLAKTSYSHPARFVRKDSHLQDAGAKSDVARQFASGSELRPTYSSEALLPYHASTRQPQPSLVSARGSCHTSTVGSQATFSQTACECSKADIGYSHSGYQSQWSKVVDVEFIRTDVYYDLHVPGPEHYLADGIWSHNSGKTYMEGKLSELWDLGVGAQVLGLSKNNNAADELSLAGVKRSMNFDRFRTAQEALQNDTMAPKLREAIEKTYGVNKRTLVLVDEISTLTDEERFWLDEFSRREDVSMVWVGDRGQVQSVGANATLDLVADASPPLTLNVARRFNQPWQREHSVGLHDGKAEAIVQYERHGSILSGTREEMDEKAIDYVVADLYQGKNSLLMVPNTELADEKSTYVRQRLIELGVVDGSEAFRLHNDTYVSVGDLIQARDTQRQMKDRPLGESISNRDLFHVKQLNSNGSLSVLPIIGYTADGPEYGGERTLPPEYVRLHVELGYVTTVHSKIGRTVENSYTVGLDPNDWHVVYTAMTRGKESNVIFVPVEHEDGVPVETGAEVLTRAAERHREGLGDIERASATEALRQEQDAVTHLARLGPIYENELLKHTTSEHREMLKNILGDERYERMRREDEMGALLRLTQALEREGQDVERVVREAAERRELSTADSIARVLHTRITNDVGPVPPRDVVDGTERYVDAVPAGDTPELEHLRAVAGKMDGRADELAERQVVEPEEWAIKHLGEVPADPVDRLAWTEKARPVAAYRERYDVKDQATGIGPAPGRHAAEQRAEWEQAYTALGRPAENEDVARLSDGELLLNVEQQRRIEAWLPPDASRQLESTSKAAREYTAQAVLDRAKGDEKAAAVSERLAKSMASRAAKFEKVHEARRKAEARYATERELANASQLEYDRRHPVAERPEDERHEERQADDERRAHQRDWTIDHAVERAEQVTEDLERTRIHEQETARQRQREAELHHHDRNDDRGYSR